MPIVKKHLAGDRRPRPGPAYPRRASASSCCQNIVWLVSPSGRLICQRHVPEVASTRSAAAPVILSDQQGHHVAATRSHLGQNGGAGLGRAGLLIVHQIWKLFPALRVACRIVDEAGNQAVCAGGRQLDGGGDRDEMCFCDPAEWRAANPRGSIRPSLHRPARIARRETADRRRAGRQTGGSNPAAPE